MGKIVYLSKNEDFTNCIKYGNKLNTKTLLIFYKKTTFHISRIGISISKKNSKLAVNRNYIRRQIKSFFYTSKIVLKDSYDVVIVVKSNFSKNNYLDNLTELKMRINERKLLNLSKIKK